VPRGKRPTPPPGSTPPKPRKAAKPSKAVQGQVDNVRPIRPTGAEQGRNARRESPTNPANLYLAERRSDAYALRRAGLTFPQVARSIADKYDLPSYTRADAYNDVIAMRDGIAVEPAKEVLFEDLDRLMALQAAVWPKAMKGDIDSVKAALSILERRSKYLGLDSPIKQILTGPDGGPIQLESLADPQKAYAAALAALDEALPHPKAKQLPGGAS
jgi:hypothetical protein